MKDNILIGLLNPMIALIFASTFLVFWSRDKERTYIFVIAVSYLSMGVGFLVSLFGPDEWILLRSAISNFCYAAATVMLVWALAKRANLVAPILLLSTIAALSVPFNTWLKITSDNINASLYATNFIIGIMFGIGAWILRNNTNKNLIERILFWTILLTAIQFWVRPIISLAIETNIQPDEYRQTTYWVVLNFTTALFSVLVALALIAASARDVMSDVIKDTSFDHLTGLKIRRVFDEDARKMINDHASRNVPLSLILLDVDHFKEINDTYGHPCGDQVLSTLGNVLKQSIRETDVAGRVGGEEFCILLSNTDGKASQVFAEGLRLKLPTIRLSCLPSSNSISASFGVVSYKKGDSLDELYKRADKALYQAKESGRNCVRMG